MNIGKTLIIISYSFLFVGCATYPISKQLREQAANGPTFTMVQKNPNAYIGKTVIWGGKIINTTNDSSVSQIMVLQIPLDKNEVPNSEMQSQGRFLAENPSFLDPEIFKADRKVTLAGTVAGAKPMLINKLLYKYPVVNLRQIHIWRKTQTYYGYPYYPGYWWGFGYNDGFDGFYDGYGGGFYGGFPDEDNDHNHMHNGGEEDNNLKENNKNDDHQQLNNNNNNSRPNEESGKNESHQNQNNGNEGHNDQGHQNNGAQGGQKSK